MQIGARTGAWSGKALPYLRRVAYLRGSGTQWIDTGLKVHKDMVFDSVFTAYAGSQNESSTNCSVWGAYDSEIDRCSVACVVPVGSMNGLGNRFIDRTISFPSKIENWKGIRLEEHRSNREMTIHGVNWGAFNSKSSAVASRSISLFGLLIPDGSRRISTVDFEQFMVSVSNEIIMSLIPVLDLSGRPCMYNQAPSEVPADDPSRFFYNASGEGEFTPGPDVT